MNISQFWTLVKRIPDKPLPGPVLQLAPVCILELTEDGMAFIWPVEPDREERCQYCAHYRGVPTSVFSVNEYRATYCQPPVHPAYPCNFIAAADAEHQDLDSYILDGSCQDAGGYFESLQQFLNDHDYSERDLTIVQLGSFTGISSAREAWSQHSASLR